MEPLLSLTAWVAERAPDYAPTIVGRDDERAWLLLESFPEAPERPTVDQVAAAAATHARVQIESTDDLESLREVAA